VAAVVSVSALAAPKPEPAADSAPPTPNGRIEGRVLRADGKTPVAGAIVRACFLDDAAAAPHRSEPSSARGAYVLPALSPGYAEVVVETPEGVFSASAATSVEPGRTRRLDLVLLSPKDRPESYWTDHPPRVTTCASGVLGSANIAQGEGSTGFLHSRTGIAIVVGGALALVLAASGSGI
jgi:hypothetical protein